MLRIAILLLAATAAHADDVTYSRTEGKKDGSVWQDRLEQHKKAVHFAHERLTAPEGRYIMAKNKDDFWDVQDLPALAKAVAAFDKLPAGKAKPVDGKEWVEICVEGKAKRCVKRAVADKPNAEEAAMDKVRWELMNHTELDSL